MKKKSWAAQSQVSVIIVTKNFAALCDGIAKQFSENNHLSNAETTEQYVFPTFTLELHTKDKQVAKA